MFITRPLWIRAIEGANGEGSAPVEPTGEPQKETPGGQEQGKAPAEAEDPNGRGSKQAVLADLARERDKRQELEAKLAEFQKADEERKRAEMSEVERLQADLEAARKAEESARAEIAKRDLEGERSKLAAEFKFPAAMAGRITGATPEEMREDAKALAEAIGPYTGPADKSAGRGSTNSSPFDLNAAIAAHYN